MIPKDITLKHLRYLAEISIYDTKTATVSDGVFLWIVLYTVRA
jgi:hypothetical protein